MPSRGIRRFAPVLMVVLVALLVLLSVATSLFVVRHFRREAASASRLYAGVFTGLNDPRPGAEASALLRLGEHVKELGHAAGGHRQDRPGDRLRQRAVPGDDRRPEAAGIRQRSSIARNPPVVDSLVGTIHYGGMPAGRIITALVVFEAVTIAVIIGIAVFAYRAAIDSQRDRVWVAHGARGGAPAGHAADEPARLDRDAALATDAAARALPITSWPTRSGWIAWRSGSSASATRHGAS